MKWLPAESAAKQGMEARWPAGNTTAGYRPGTSPCSWGREREGPRCPAASPGVKDLLTNAGFLNRELIRGARYERLTDESSGSTRRSGACRRRSRTARRFGYWRYELEREGAIEVRQRATI